MSVTAEQLPSVLSLTDGAVEQLKTLLAREDKDKSFRVYVEGGGCSGLQYGMVFDEKRADDLTTEVGGVCVLVDPFSAGYLKGAIVDFEDGLNGSGFKVKNPNARLSCGCGKSFEA
jgi:iron-sulfur cluster assembly accessory protein